ncbi:MAG: histone-like nucleoid-structuring protein Lsr2 [Microthrixaceae bacterium]
MPRAALVVEDRYSAVFKSSFVAPLGCRPKAWPSAQVRFPSVPIVFCETRPLAQEWTYRFLGAALAHHAQDAPAAGRVAELPAAGPLAPAAPTAAEIRAWALANGHEISAKGRIPTSVREAFNEAR